MSSAKNARRDAKNERRNAKRRAQREDANQKSKTRCIQNIAVTVAQVHPSVELKVQLLLRDGRHVSAIDYAAEVGAETLVEQLGEHREAVEKKRRERQVHDLVIGNGLNAAARKAQLRSAYHHAGNSMYPPCFCGSPMEVVPDQDLLMCVRLQLCAFWQDPRFKRAAPKCLQCGSSLKLHPDHATRLLCEKTECATVFEKTDLWAQLSERAREMATEKAKKTEAALNKEPRLEDTAKPAKRAKIEAKIEEPEEDTEEEVNWKQEKDSDEDISSDRDDQDFTIIPAEKEDTFASNEERVVAILLEHLEFVRDHMVHGEDMWKYTPKAAWFTTNYRYWSIAKCDKGARRASKQKYRSWSEIVSDLLRIAEWLAKLGPKSKFALPYMKACAKLISEVANAKGTWPPDQQDAYCALVGVANLTS